MRRKYLTEINYVVTPENNIPEFNCFKLNSFTDFNQETFNISFSSLKVIIVVDYAIQSGAL